MLLETIFLAQVFGCMAPGNPDHCYISGHQNPPTLVGDGTATTTSAPLPTCPDGYTLMSDLTMHPKCAKDIIEPSYK